MSSLELALKEAMEIDGALAVALVDLDSGIPLGSDEGKGGLDPAVAAAGNTEVIRAKLRVMRALNLNDEIEDILVTLGAQYHLLRLLQSNAGQDRFLYLALDRAKANLAMARRRLRAIEELLTL